MSIPLGIISIMMNTTPTLGLVGSVSSSKEAVAELERKEREENRSWDRFG
jgi:hypothetical protein